MSQSMARSLNLAKAPMKYPPIRNPNFDLNQKIDYFWSGI
jgi:hypothetical protein